jgi:hypothetical protein
MGAGVAVWRGGASTARAAVACRLGFMRILRILDTGAGAGAGAGGWRAGGVGLGRLRMVTTGTEFVTGSRDCRQNGEQCNCGQGTDRFSWRPVWLACHHGRG